MECNGMAVVWGSVLGLTRERRLAASKIFELITDDVDLAEITDS